MMILGADEGSEGDKSKVFAMQEGPDESDITDDDYRMTAELRGRELRGAGIGDLPHHRGRRRLARRRARRSSTSTARGGTSGGSRGRRAAPGSRCMRDSETGQTIYDSRIGTGSHPYRPDPHFLLPRARRRAARARLTRRCRAAPTRTSGSSPTPRPNFPSCREATGPDRGEAEGTGAADTRPLPSAFCLLPSASRLYNGGNSVSTNTFRLQYLGKAAAGVPRDLVNTFINAKVHAIRPTVLIYNCTWVCDAKCTMCNNWKWGDRKSDMTLDAARAGPGQPVLGRGREPQHLRRRADDAHRPARDGGDVPQASAPPAQDRHQHDRPDPDARHPDAHAHRRVLRREGHPDQHPRLARRHRRRPQPGPRREERLRQGVADDRGDAGAVEGASDTSSSASRRRSSRRTSRTPRTS